MKKICALMSACSLGFAVHAQVIDNFNSIGLSEYTQTVVLQNGGPSSGIAFSDATGTLAVSKASGSFPEQVLLLRNDFSLGVGQILRIDAAAPATVTDYTDFGLALSALVNPPAAVYAGANVSTRQDYINVYLKRSTSQVGYIGFNGTSVAFSSSGVTPVPNFASITGLYISRLAAGSFNVGYSTTSGDTSLFTLTGMNNSIGNALGFYADVRVPTSYGFLDNLRIEAVPEPSTFALCGMGLAGLLALRRKK